MTVTSPFLIFKKVFRLLGRMVGCKGGENKVETGDPDGPPSPESPVGKLSTLRVSGRRRARTTSEGRQQEGQESPVKIRK